MNSSLNDNRVWACRLIKHCLRNLFKHELLIAWVGESNYLMACMSSVLCLIYNVMLHLWKPTNAIKIWILYHAQLNTSYWNVETEKSLDGINQSSVPLRYILSNIKFIVQWLNQSKAWNLRIQKKKTFKKIKIKIKKKKEQDFSSGKSQNIIGRHNIFLK